MSTPGYRQLIVDPDLILTGVEIWQIGSTIEARSGCCNSPLERIDSTWICFSCDRQMKTPKAALWGDTISAATLAMTLDNPSPGSADSSWFYYWTGLTRDKIILQKV